MTRGAARRRGSGSGTTRAAASTLPTDQREILSRYAYTRPGWLGEIAPAISSCLRALGSGHPPPDADLAALRHRAARVASFPELDAAVGALVEALDAEVAAAAVPHLQALTLIQPMASALVAPSPRYKSIENRDRALPRWRIGRPTVLAVHAGHKWREDYASTCMRLLGDEVDWDRATNLGGRVLGLVLLSGRQFTTEAPPPAGHPGLPWFTGLFGYEVTGRAALPDPVDCRGGRGWWPVPPAVTRRVLDQLPEWQTRFHLTPVGPGGSTA